MRFHLPVLAAVCCLSCVSRPRPTPWPEVRGTVDASSQRRVAQGELVGFADSPSTFAWLGVPYAAAPVGRLRWSAPRPPSHWEPTVRNATRYSALCPQFGGRLTSGDESEVVGDEDCLALNISAPQQASDEKRPVMVWLHGGGNSIGTANSYGVMRNLAAKYGVVVISVNYRLGVLGWFHHAAVLPDDASDEDRSGNYGTLDLIAALKWVRDNISSFGGDPRNVTVFGESAGGFNVFSLLVAPAARGLFHRAIIQSGMPATRTIAEAENFVDAPDPGMATSSSELLLTYLQRDGRAADRAAAKTVLAQMSPRDIGAYLHAKTPQELIGPLKGAGFGMYLSPALLRDGLVLPISTITESLADPNRGEPVPVLLGTNRDEAKLFMAFNPKYVGKTLGLFPFIRDPVAYERDSELVSNLWRWLGTDAPARALTQSQGPSVFAYRFDWDEEPSRLGTDVSKLLGAAHGLEISFVFDDVEGEMDAFGIVTEENKASRGELANAMSSYWVNFAKTGAPGRGVEGKLAEWAPYGDGRFMTFDSTQGGGSRMQTGTQSPDAIEQRLWNEVTDPTEQCRGYFELFGKFARPAGGWTAARQASYRAHCPEGRR